MLGTDELDQMEARAAAYGVRVAILDAYHMGRAEAYNEVFNIVAEPGPDETGPSTGGPMAGAVDAAMGRYDA